MTSQAADRDRDAVHELIRLAESLDDDSWRRPRAVGKWSPAEEITHVGLVYEVLARELAGGTGLRLRGNRWRRMVWRWVAMRTVLVEGQIPRAVHAPREVRPVVVDPDRTAVLDGLRARWERFEAELDRARRERPGARVTHPFFGALTLAQASRFAAVHTRHHASLIARRADRAP